MLINFYDEVIKSLIETCTHTVYTFRLSHNGAEFYYSSQNFARNSDSFAERLTRMKMVDEIKIHDVTRNGAMVIGSRQRDKAPATKENSPTLYDPEPKLSERRTRESERARADYIKWLVKRSA